MNRLYIPIFLILFLSSNLYADTLPKGADVTDAFGLKISKYGFEFLSSIVPEFVPPEFPVEDTSSSFSCVGSDVNMTISGLIMYIEVTGAEIIPMDGYLDIYIDAIVSSNQAYMYLEGGCFWGSLSLDETCLLEIPPTDTEMHTTISFFLDPNTHILSGIVGDIEVSVGHIDNVLSNCTLSNIIEILGYMGIDIIDYLVGMYVDKINSELKPTIEESLNEALAYLNVNEEFEVQGATIEAVLYPNQFTLDPTGMLIFMAGHLVATSGTNCVPTSDGSYYTDNPPPAFGETIPGTTTRYHIGATLSDDIANQGLFALWDGGALCYSLYEIGGSEISSFYLKMLCGGFNEIFPETQPAIFEIVPYDVPIVYFDGPDQINITISGINFEPYSIISERFARIFSMGISGEVGLNLRYEEGFIYIDVEMDTEDMNFTVEYNELYPACNPELEEKFSMLIDTILPSIDELIPPIEIPLSGGISLSSLEIVSPAGSGNDFISFYGELEYDPEADGGGCSGEDGGGSSSCQSCEDGGEGSCNFYGGEPGSLLPFIPLLLYIILKKRYYR